MYFIFYFQQTLIMQHTTSNTGQNNQIVLQASTGQPILQLTSDQIQSLSQQQQINEHINIQHQQQQQNQKDHQQQHIIQVRFSELVKTKHLFFM